MKIKRRFLGLVLVIIMIMAQLNIINVQAATTSNPTSRIYLNKTVEKNQWGLNEEFTVNYTIQPQDIPENLVPESLYHKKGADISLIIDTSGSMAYGLDGNSDLKNSICYVEDSEGEYYIASNNKGSFYGLLIKDWRNRKYFRIGNDDYKIDKNNRIYFGQYTINFNKRYKKIQKTELSRMEIVKKAANNFIDQFKNYSNIRIGLIGYAEDAYQSKKLVNNSYFNEIKDIMSSTDEFKAGGATNIGDGLRKAYWQLANNSSSDKKKFIVLLTDGEPTKYSYYKDKNSNNSFCDDYYYYYHYLYDSRNDNYHIDGGGNNDSDGRATNYANEVAKMIAADKSINSFMIAFSKDATNNKLDEISKVASNNQLGFYKEATTVDDLNDIYDKIAETILSDLPIYGLQLEETFPSGVDIVSVSNGLKLDKNNNKRVIGDIGNINYKLDTVNHVFKAEPINFWVKLKGTKVGNYVLGKDYSGNSTSFVNYKDIDGKQVTPPPSFPNININIYNNKPPMIEANLKNDYDKDNYKLEVNVDKPSDIVVKSTINASTPIVTQNHVNDLVSGNEHTYILSVPTTEIKSNIDKKIYSLTLEAIDKDRLKTVVTIPLISTQIVKNQINNFKNDILIKTEINSTIQEIILNGKTMVINKITDDNGEYCLSNVSLIDGNNSIIVKVVNSYNNTTQFITNANIKCGVPRVSIEIHDNRGVIDKYEELYSSKTSSKVDKIFKETMILKGNAVAQIEVKDEKLKNVKYKFVTTTDMPQDGEFITINNSIKQEVVYPDLVKDKVGYLTARNYDVSSLPVMNNESIWNDRSQVFHKPSSVIEYRSANCVNSINQYISKIDGKFKNYTIFMNELNLGNREIDKNAPYPDYEESAKFWGYITPPETHDYYFGTKSDDGSQGYIIVNGDKVQIVDQFKIQGSTFKTDNNGVHLEKGKYYPIYLEYSNWGGKGEFRLIYKKTKFNSNNNETGGATVPAEWFRPSSNTNPGEVSTATFESTAVAGIPFPEQTGTYYIAFKAENEAGGVREGVYGPFLVDKTFPTASFNINPNTWTKDKVNITITASDKDSGVLRVRKLDKNWTNGNTATYTVSENGKYDFEVEDNAGNIAFVSYSITNIDKTPSIVVNKGIFLNEKLIDSDINIVRSFNANIGIGIKTIFDGQDVKLQINKDSNNVQIEGNAFDLYEVTNETDFTIKEISKGIVGTVKEEPQEEGKTQKEMMQEFTIPMTTASKGYKYYLIVFKLNINRESKVETVAGNKLKINSQIVKDDKGEPFEFIFNVKDLPPLE